MVIRGIAQHEPSLDLFHAIFHPCSRCVRLHEAERRRDFEHSKYADGSPARPLQCQKHVISGNYTQTPQCSRYSCRGSIELRVGEFLVPRLNSAVLAVNLDCAPKQCKVRIELWPRQGYGRQSVGRCVVSQIHELDAGHGSPCILRDKLLIDVLQYRILRLRILSIWAGELHRLVEFRNRGDV